MKNILWFKGRIGRLEYFLTILVAIMLMSYVIAFMGAGIIPFLIHIFFTWIIICAGIKRFHDLGNPGVYVFLLLIPFALIYFACLKGNVGANEYGDDPLKNKNAAVAREEVKPIKAFEHVKGIFKYKKIFNQDNEKSIKRSDVKYCRHCGVKHIKDVKFCSSCGKPVA